MTKLSVEACFSNFQSLPIDFWIVVLSVTVGNPPDLEAPLRHVSVLCCSASEHRGVLARNISIREGLLLISIYGLVGGGFLKSGVKISGLKSIK